MAGVPGFIPIFRTFVKIMAGPLSLASTIPSVPYENLRKVISARRNRRST
jgi:hypothetical protein